jgi:hypothetical protein
MMTHYNTDKLLFRRQFILAPGPASNLTSWQQTKIGGQFWLQAHPDLEMLQLTKNGLELTLLGYLIDPHNPDLSNRELLEKLFKAIRQPADVFGNTENYGGRWVLILHHGGETVVLNDPTGLRQIHFTDTTIPQIFCASQPSIIAEQLSLSVDETVQEQFIKPQILQDKEYWLCGDLSPYMGIRHLLPNHYLNLKTRSVHRFWPREKLKVFGPREAIDKSCALLKGQWAAITKRFEPAMPITAGLDTRTLFAASKELSDRIYYYTLMYCINTPMTEESPDIRIPSSLLSRFGLKHNVIKCLPVMDENFKKIYKRSVSLAHDCWGSIVQTLCSEYPQERVAVDGSCSEIARQYYCKRSNYSENGEIDAAALADLCRMVKIPLVLTSFEKWLSEARVVEKEYELKILDLFYWEQRMGNWNAMAQQELDIAQETFSPFNNRELLTTLLGVDSQLRTTPDFSLYKRIIRRLWPQVLSEPINPVSRRVRLKQIAQVLLRKLRVYRIVRSVYRQIVK